MILSALLVRSKDNNLKPFHPGKSNCTVYKDNVICTFPVNSLSIQ